METDTSITSCICNKNDIQDVFMIQCDKCNIWQHSLCMGYINEDLIPDIYYCQLCNPREIKSITV